jgi:hypothetical protein
MLYTGPTFAKFTDCRTNISGSLVAVMTMSHQR